MALSPEESHHGAKVLRLRVGDEVALFDGRGGAANACVACVAGGRVEVEVGEPTSHGFDASVKLTVAVAMPKSHRQAYLVEKCTELAVAGIWPITTERSVARVSSGAVEKLRRRAIEAVKQSHRYWAPRIEASRTFAQCLEHVGSFDAIYLMDATADAVSLRSVLSEVTDGQSVLALIGPEGGWAEAERSAALAVGGSVVRLGRTVLRTETAAVAVCAAITAFASR